MEKLKIVYVTDINFVNKMNNILSWKDVANENFIFTRYFRIILPEEVKEISASIL